jgi:hypothetical protein|tara:strand:- start:274 stop:522 length:249 start_codon:yes stop_codon:yes gene_type:complete
MCYTTIKIHAEQLAAKLAQRKVEKKWEALGWSPYVENIHEYVGARYTENAEKDYKKHYDYFMEIILSKKLTEKKLEEKPLAE